MKAVSLSLLLLLAIATSAVAAASVKRPPRPLQGPAQIPTAAVLVRERLLTKISAVIVPFLEQLALTTPIPASSGEHWSFDTFYLSNFTLGGVSATFDGGETVSLYFNSVSLAVPTTPFFVFESILGHKFGCHGTFSATTSGSNLRLNVVLGRSATNGSLVLAEVDADATFGQLNVQHDFPGEFCSAADKLISFFVGGITGVLQNLVKEMLPAKIASVVYNKSNTVLNRLPLRLAADPVVTDAFAELVPELLPSNATPPDVVPPRFVQFIPQRDAEVYVDQGSLNGLLAHLAATGALQGSMALPAELNTTAVRAALPGAFAACPGCPMFAEASVVAVAPVITISAYTATLAVTNATLALAALPPNNASAIPLLVASVTAQLGVASVTFSGPLGNVLDFNLFLPTLNATLVESRVGDVPVGTLAGLLSWTLREVLLPLFNARFPGVPLPVVRNATVLLTPGQVGAAVDVDLSAL